jgi:hypothetical protein
VAAVLLAIILLLGSGLAALAALGAAKLGRFDRVMALLYARGADDVELRIERLAAAAELARREGLLVLERQAAQRGERLIRRGVALALEGCPAGQVRLALAEEAGQRQSRASVARLAQAGAVLGCGGVLALGVSAAAGAGIGTALAALAWIGLCLALPCALIAGTIAEVGGRGGRGKGAELEFEAAVLIAEGCDGEMVRSRLWASASGGEAGKRAAA